MMASLFFDVVAAVAVGAAVGAAVVCVMLRVSCGGVCHAGHIGHAIYGIYRPSVVLSI